MSKKTIEERVITSSVLILKQKKYVSVIDILLNMDWLTPTHVHDWRKGKIPYLEKVIQTNLSKISHAIRAFQSWANENNLKASETAYILKTGNSKRNLIFTKFGDKNLEKAYQTHYISPELSEKKAERFQQKLSKPEDIVVYMLVKDYQCSKCSNKLYKGSFLFMDTDEPLCLECANLAHLTYLPAGNTKLTRYAKKYSDLWTVVVRYSRARKQYERQGLLVEADALKKAEEEC